MNRASLDLAVSLVWSGFYGPEEVLEMVEEHCFLEDLALNSETLQKAVEGEFAAKREEEAEWPAVTDCDRLEQAFAALNRQGIIALANAGFTESEGLEEIHAAYVARGGQFMGVRGYCFYHAQDLEGAVAGLGLHLSYGSSDGDTARGVAVGEEICGLLRAHGLTVDWNGTLAKRLCVILPVWMKRSRGVLGGPA